MEFLRNLWKYSLVVTLPVSILLVVWALRTYDLYEADRLNFGIVHQDVVLLDSGRLNFMYLLESLRRSITGSKNKADINIYVDNKMLHELNSDLPYSGLGGENFKPAYMLYPDGNLERIKLRYRGDAPNHWLFKEKSYRIKTRKKKLLGNMRNVNLIVLESPDLLAAHMSYKLAEIMGLLGPKSEIVTVNINGKNDGVKLFVEQIDESFLRRRGIMPGDIYSGDNLGRGRFWGLDTSLFKTALNWEKSSANNHYDLQSKIPLQNMITGIQKNDFASLDLEQFGKFSAYIDITRSRHIDEFHNWKLHYDAYLEKMSPVVWDSFGWTKDWLSYRGKGGIAFSTLMKKLYRNHDFLYERQKALIHFFKNQQNDFFASLDAETKVVEDKTAGMNFFVDHLRVIRSRGEMWEAATEFGNAVRVAVEEVKKATVDREGTYSYSLIDDGARLAISDVPVSSFMIDLDPGAGPVTIAVRYKADGSLIERDVTSLSERKGNRILVEQRLIPPTVIKRRSHFFGEATFDILIGGVDASSIQSISVTPMSIDSREVSAERIEHLDQLEFKDQFSIIPAVRDSVPLVFSGTKTIEGFEVIERDLVIEPGTRLIFSEGAGLKVLGKLTAIGTEDAPITFAAADPDLPWGAVVIKDHASDGSRFEHCLFENGSGVKGDVFEYTAMLSVHNVSQVLISESTFRNSQLTDDMLHVVYGDIRIENSRFLNSHSDAADLDITNAEIVGSRFVGSGNDAIDLMTSKAMISGTEMSKSGDKGASIGENSLLFAVNSQFLDNHIGIESKDSSDAVIFNSLIRGNDLGVHAYRKNWQYGTGGKLTVGNSVFEGNRELSLVGEKSEIAIVDSYVDDLPVAEDLPLLIQTDSRFRERAQSRPPLKLEGVNEFFTNYLSLVNNDVRGVFVDTKDD